MSPLLISILFYIFLMLSIFSFKPKFCFTQEGQMKKFGIGKNKTPFTFLSISIIMGLFSLILSVIYTEYMSPIASEVISHATEITQSAINTLSEMD